MFRLKKLKEKEKIVDTLIHMHLPPSLSFSIYIYIYIFFSYTNKNVSGSSNLFLFPPNNPINLSEHKIISFPFLLPLIL